jgi:hypothetical protein
MAEWDIKKAAGATLGSYGFAMFNLAQALEIGEQKGWITEDEAKAEFRANVRTVREKEDNARRAAELRAEADELDG